MSHALGTTLVFGQERIAPVASTQLEYFSSPLTRTDLQLTGSASCSSAACHGGPRAGVLVDASPRGAEYPIWLANDPHGKSWRTVCSDASVGIMEKLGILRAGSIVNQAAFDNCLACHNTTRKFSEPRSGQFHSEGVGCASCHGPSERWYGNHYRLPLDDLTAADVGLVPTSNLLGRARMCAACHVGDRDRDMNHDIIAAGHPALYYEFATFHNRLPKHWREPQQSATPDFEARLWLAGQIAGLDADAVFA